MKQDNLDKVAGLSWTRPCDSKILLHLDTITIKDFSLSLDLIGVEFKSFAECRRMVRKEKSLLTFKT